jgi:hypothetical protein
VACRQPFSRRDADGDLDERGPDERLLDAFEFVAAEYGWKVQEVDEELSDEQLVSYLDSASSRIERRARADFDGWVEAVRLGTIVAHDAALYRRWKRDRDAKPTKPMSDAAIEAGIMRLAGMFPENVMRGTV